MEFKKVDLGTPRKARQFLTFFLLTQCISGAIYSAAELQKTYKEVKKMVKKMPYIGSSDLPIRTEETNFQLHKAIYKVEGSFCFLYCCEKTGN